MDHNGQKLGWRLSTNTNVVVMPTEKKRGESPEVEGLARVTLLFGDEGREPSLVLSMLDRTEERRHVVTMGYAKAKEMRDVLDLALATIDRMAHDEVPGRSNPEKEAGR